LVAGSLAVSAFTVTSSAAFFASTLNVSSSIASAESLTSVNLETGSTESLIISSTLDFRLS